ncbi:MAG: sulfatase-like hydrolase/transferase [Victivallaceae bacterium]|nr:sulfatase-like hydrolase/transferase [Victivallaceae bacterium]
MKKKPNILLITSDQQHWAAVGFNNPEVKTPNLDRLAESGTVFNRAYCPNPTCTPTRASIITGRYPSQHGAYTLGTKTPENIHTVGDDFHQHGYRTALIGKAHFQPLYDHPKYRSIESNPLQQNLDFWREFHGPFYGFDHVELARNHADEYHVGQHYGIWMEEKGFTGWRKCFRKPAGTAEPQHLKWNIPEEFHYDAWIAERTNAMLTEYAENEEHFFLWASFLDPHPPYLAPEPWDTMYNPEKITVPGMLDKENFSELPPHYAQTQQPDADFSEYTDANGFGCHGVHGHLHDRRELAKNIAVYYGMISLMDKYIGKILARLEALGLRKDTLIIFTTDHGHFHGQHGLIAKGPFHYEDMIKVPFLAALPGSIPERKRTDAMLSLVDLAPTFLSYCGIEIPRCMTGVDQKTVFTGENAQARTGVIVENNHQPGIINLKTYVDERYKISVYQNKNYGELFDLENDPAETTNLWNVPAFQELKRDLLLQFIQAEMAKEPLHMPRVWGA